jgi:hypothetical protein
VLRVFWCGALSLTRGRVCRFPESQSAVISLLLVCTICILHVIKCMYIQHIRVYGLCQSRLSTADHALSLVAPATTAVYSLEMSYAWPPPSLSLSYFLCLCLGGMGFLLYNVRTDWQRKHFSISYPQKRRPLADWFPRIHLHGNVFVYPLPSNGSPRHNAIQ